MKTFEVILVNNTDTRQEKITQIIAESALHAAIVVKNNNPGWTVKSSDII